MKNQICRCFTLVELLTVLAVIGVLSAIGLGVYSTAQSKSRVSAAQSIVENISGAFQAAKSDVGYVPASNWTEIKLAEETIDGQNLLTLSGLGDKKFKKAFAKYIDMELLHKYLDSDGYLTDPWGGKIYYCYPGIAKKTECCVISAGPDGGFGSSKQPDGNLPTTPEKTSLSSYKSSGEWTCDDVANF